MSGVVVEVRVKEGQEVKKGDVLAVQSAMKVHIALSSRVSNRTDEIILGIDGECRVFSSLWARQARVGS